MKVCLKSFYYQSCFEELRVLKPGNHSINSKILGMDHKKFELGAKISSLITLHVDFSEIFFSSQANRKMENGIINSKS